MWTSRVWRSRESNSNDITVTSNVNPLRHTSLRRPTTIRVTALEGTVTSLKITEGPGLSTGAGTLAKMFSMTHFAAIKRAR